MCYVIGKSKCNFIQIKLRSMLDYMYNIYDEIDKVVYDCNLEEATIINDYDEAKEILDEIQSRIAEIDFDNISIIGQIIDNEKEFNKVEYAKKLKIFKLVPTLVEY